MANYWKMEENEWVRQPIQGDVVEFPVPERFVSAGMRHPRRNTGKTVIKKFVPTEATPYWALLFSMDSRVRVNGNLLCTGLHILRDRDEVSLDGESFLYFSTEEVATVERFPVSDHPVFCARCRQSIENGSPAVRCPSCGHWCEQSETKPCWTYGTTCPLCDQPTAFDTGLRWTPETL